MNDLAVNATVREIVAKHRDHVGSLVTILKEIQTVFGYLPRNALRIVGQTTERSMVEVYGVASFHDCFRLTPPQENSVPLAAEVRCPYCNHSLVDPEVRIDGRPAIWVTAAFGFEHGHYRFLAESAAAVDSEHELPRTGEVSFFCPHCHAELLAPSSCVECGAPLVPAVGPGGRLVYWCANGCVGTAR